MIVMYDSVTVDEIPKGAQAVAGYVGGRYLTFPTIQKMFPHAELLSIAIDAAENAECLDIENGDATPDQAPAWFGRQHTRGVWRPCLYCDLSNVEAVNAAMTKAGVARREYRLWVAHYTNVAHVEPGADATQWTDKALGRNLDESLCLPSFFPQAVHKPPPAKPADRTFTATVELDAASERWTVKAA